MTLIRDFQRMGDSMYQDAVSSGQLQRDPPVTREKIMRDVLRYIKMIVAFEIQAARLENEREQAMLEANFEPEDEDSPAPDLRNLTTDQQPGLTREEQERLWAEEDDDEGESEYSGEDSQESEEIAE